MEKELAAEGLKKLADNTNPLEVLYEFGDNVRIRIPVTKAVCDMNISELELSVRSSNGLMRAGLDTVGKVIDEAMSENGIEGVRNLGKKSISEIKTALFLVGYTKLSSREKVEFWEYAVENNTASN